MPLSSKLFVQPTRLVRLENCLTDDAWHIARGQRGEHVLRIQSALNQLSAGPGRENFNLKQDGVYGPLTADAVQAYKSAPSRRILGPGQKTPDKIVGKRTIESLDDETKNELIAYPTDDILDKSQVYTNLPQETLDYYSTLWTDIKNS